TDKDFWGDNHKKSLKDTLEMFDFITFADRDFSQHLAKRNRIIIPDEDGKYIEFIIDHSRKYRDNTGLKVGVFTSASYLALKKAKVIKPNTFNGTAEQHVIETLAGTEVKPGHIEYAGVLEIELNEYSDPYKHLKRIASTFGLELIFRTEIENNKAVR